MSDSNRFVLLANPEELQEKKSLKKINSKA